MKKLREFYFAWEDRVYRWKNRLRIFRRKSEGVVTPIFALCQLALGGVFFYYGMLIWNDPQKYWAKVSPSSEQLESWGLDRLWEKTSKLIRKVNQNADYTLMRQNMEIVKLMLEAYPIEEHGYPPDVSSLYHEATGKGFWRSIRNPFTMSSQGYEGSLANFSDYENNYTKSGYQGMIIYHPQGTSPIRAYRLYGCDDNGELIKRNNGEVFFLSHAL